MEARNEIVDKQHSADIVEYEQAEEAEAPQTEPTETRRAELAMMERIKRTASVLTESERKSLSSISLPPFVDYLSNLSLVRYQGRRQIGAGGCYLAADVAAVDMLKKRRFPYTPDLSYRFLTHVNGKYPDPQGRIQGLLDGDQVLESYGCSPEAVWPMVFDQLGLVDHSTIPLPATFADAKMYRTAKNKRAGGVPFTAGPRWVDANQLNTNEVKRMLVKNGPLLADGGGHTKVLVGYDDRDATFTLLNSYGDRFGNNGTLRFPQSRFRTPSPNDPSLNIDSLTYLEDRPRIGPRLTGRVRIRTLSGRRFLVVRVGMQGQQPMTVWDYGNQGLPAHNIADDSLNLTLDFPLPTYEIGSWPPSNSRQWFVEVSYLPPAGGRIDEAIVEDVVLVERIPFLANQPGTPVAFLFPECIPILYRPAASHIHVQRRGTVSIFIPTRKFFTLDLRAVPSSIPSGGSTELMGTLKVCHQIASNLTSALPLSGKRVQLQCEQPDQIEQGIGYLIGTCTTDTQGKFSLFHSPRATSQYRAFAIKENYSIMASSSHVTVTVG